MPLLAAVESGSAGSEPPAGAGLGFFIPVILIMVIFFWLTHRSQKKKEQARRDMLDSIKVGDDVVSIGGIRGRVTQITDDTFVIRVNDEKDIKMTFNKGAISGKVGDEKQES
jgi:preprotein translocase subunit YajC